MNKQRQYFVSYAHSRGFGNFRIATDGLFEIGKLPEQLIEECIQKKDRVPEDIIILSFIEINPKKEVWELKDGQQESGGDDA